MGLNTQPTHSPLYLAYQQAYRKRDTAELERIRKEADTRLASIKKSIQEEDLGYGELLQLQGELRPFIPAHEPELLEAAGVPEGIASLSPDIREAILNVLETGDGDFYYDSSFDKGEIPYIGEEDYQANLDENGEYLSSTSQAVRRHQNALALLRSELYGDEG